MSEVFKVAKALQVVRESNTPTIEYLRYDDDAEAKLRELQSADPLGNFILVRLTIEATWAFMPRTDQDKLDIAVWTEQSKLDQ